MPGRRTRVAGGRDGIAKRSDASGGKLVGARLKMGSKVSRVLPEVPPNLCAQELLIAA